MQDQPTHQAPIRPSTCPDCLKPMHFRMSVPDEKYSMLLRVTFVCDCGRVCDHLVAKSLYTILPMLVLSHSRSP
jgi:hypothetical protein